MKLFITGRPGVGKTTVIKKFCELYPDRVVGFYTQEIREGGRRTGFRIVTTWGEERVFAHVDIDGPRVSRYGVDVKALEEVVGGLKALGQGRVLVVDEVGKMETLSGVFVRWFEGMLSSSTPVVATIPIRSGHPLVNRIRRNYPVWEVTPVNREAMPFRIRDFLKL